ncbi:MAG: MaoC/PaaZ C-terminal domain-containing protein [Anaerolineales bacterium]|nr:MaoC/PaaZ C-terminal domain-containing protein [Anaerolineales bacterium]
MYLEDFEVGQTLTTAARTVTEADIVNFAGLSGDYNQIHTDEEYSKGTIVGQRVAHGILGLSIASGLVVQTGIMEGTVQLFREISDWRFVKPIFIGDTIRVTVEVLGIKPMARLGNGIVDIELDVKNQENETVQRGTWRALFAMRPGG